MNTNEQNATTATEQKTSIINRLLNTDKDAKVREAIKGAITVLGPMVTRGDLRQYYKDVLNQRWADAKVVKNRMFQIGGEQHRGYYCLAVINATSEEQANKIKADEIKKFEAAMQRQAEAEAKAAAEAKKAKDAEKEAKKAAKAQPAPEQHPKKEEKKVSHSEKKVAHASSK